MDAAFVLQFLADLAQHNDRAWFGLQTKRYQEARAQFQEFTGAILLDLAEVRPAFGELEAAKVMFRIHRDVRFSKDKTPYKTNFSAVIGEGGKNTGDPCGYFQIGPGSQSMVACGLYEPSTAELYAIRQSIAEEASPLRAILRGMKRVYPDGLGGDRSVRVRGFAADHPSADLLGFKQYVVSRSFSDEEVRVKRFEGQLKACLRAMFPLLDWLRAHRPTTLQAVDGSAVAEHWD